MVLRDGKVVSASAGFNHQLFSQWWAKVGNMGVRPGGSYPPRIENVICPPSQDGGKKPSSRMIISFIEEI